MKHTLPYPDWHIALTETIKAAADGDIIEVHTSSMKTLAQRAKERLCPKKQIEFIVKGNDQ